MLQCCQRLEKEKDQIQTVLMAKIGNHEKAICGDYSLDWGYIHYKATEAKATEAKPAKSVRRRMVRIKERRAADLKGA